MTLAAVLSMYHSLKSVTALLKFLQQAETTVKVVKNTVAPPFRTAEFDILYGIGIDKGGEILDRAVDLGYVDKSGAWFSYAGERIGQGHDNATKYLREHPDIMTALEAKIKEHGDAPVEEPDELSDDELDIRLLGLEDDE